MPLASDLELVTLRRLRDGVQADGYDALKARYSHSERSDALDRLIEAGYGKVDHDVDYEGELYVMDAELTANGVQRLEQLEGRSIVIRRRLGRLAALVRFTKEHQWIPGAIGGAIASQWIARIWNLFGH